MTPTIGDALGALLMIGFFVAMGVLAWPVISQLPGMSDIISQYGLLILLGLAGCVVLAVLTLVAAVKALFN